MIHLSEGTPPVFRGDLVEYGWKHGVIDRYVVTSVEWEDGDRTWRIELSSMTCHNGVVFWPPYMRSLSGWTVVARGNEHDQAQ